MVMNLHLLERRNRNFMEYVLMFLFIFIIVILSLCLLSFFIGIGVYITIDTVYKLLVKNGYQFNMLRNPKIDKLIILENEIKRNIE